MRPPPPLTRSQPTNNKKCTLSGLSSSQLTTQHGPGKYYTKQPAAGNKKQQHARVVCQQLPLHLVRLLFLALLLLLRLLALVLAVLTGPDNGFLLLQQQHWVRNTQQQQQEQQAVEVKGAPNASTPAAARVGGTCSWDGPQQGLLHTHSCVADPGAGRHTVCTQPPCNDSRVSPTPATHPTNAPLACSVLRSLRVSHQSS